MIDGIRETGYELYIFFLRRIAEHQLDLFQGGTICFLHH